MSSLEIALIWHSFIIGFDRRFVWPAAALTPETLNI